jgi:DNA-binding FrmR family transcriptional regulator
MVLVRSMKRIPTKKNQKFSDHSEELSRLKKVMGQVSGIEKMFLARRHCPDIIQQIRAARSALKALELAVIKAHLASGITESAKHDSPQAFDLKLKELMALIKG